MTKRKKERKRGRNFARQKIEGNPGDKFNDGIDWRNPLFTMPTSSSQEDITYNRNIIIRFYPLPTIRTKGRREDDRNLLRNPITTDI